MLVLKNVDFKISSDGKHILKDINLSINPGSFNVIVGSNGAGKSSLLKMISGEISPSNGSILINKEDVSDLSVQKRSKYISQVFQNPGESTIASMQVRENLLLGTHRQKRKIFISKKDHLVSEKHLSQINTTLEKRSKEMVSNLSGGQRQLIGLLMATMHRREILLLDEHCSDLDPVNTDAVMKFTNDLVRQKKITCLMITHNLAHALTYGDNLIVMADGRVIQIVSGFEKKRLSEKELIQSIAEYSGG